MNLTSEQMETKIREFVGSMDDDDMAKVLAHVSGGKAEPDGHGMVHFTPKEEVSRERMVDVENLEPDDDDLLPSVPLYYIQHGMYNTASAITGSVDDGWAIYKRDDESQAETLSGDLLGVVDTETLAKAIAEMLNGRLKETVAQPKVQGLTDFISTDLPVMDEIAEIIFYRQLTDQSVCDSLEDVRDKVRKAGCQKVYDEIIGPAIDKLEDRLGY